MDIDLRLGNCLDVMKEMGDNSVDSIVADGPYGISFMGKKWDYDVPSVEIWKEALRVLKPGGYLLSFAGSRTYHRMAVNIEDAGFEIRDQIQWLYGSGFPKSFGVGKAIDKAAGVEREVIGRVENTGVGSIAVENVKQGAQQRTKESLDDYTGWDITKPATSEAAEWEGWGTALKPAHEPIVMARKPLIGTVAENVLEHGTGAINVDGCRIGNKGGTTRGANGSNAGKPRNTLHGGNFGVENIGKGRWPANVILDEEAGAMLDEQSGTTTKGGASRFFYCPKASKAERSRGCEDIEGEVRFASTNESGRMMPTKLDEPHKIKGNYHPTVKPLTLMRYLCRLVTPPEGIVLDPFMGSGTTGIAACLEGFNFVGIELEEEYLEIARYRIAHWGDYEITESDILIPKKILTEWI